MLLRHGILRKIALPRCFIAVPKAVRPYSVGISKAARALNELQIFHPLSG